jgi:hypothetical protein
VSFINMSANPLENINISASLISTKMETTWSKNMMVKVGSDAVIETGIIIPENNEMQFLKLVASDSKGGVLSENLYWIGKENNYKALNMLPEPTVSSIVKQSSGNEGKLYSITLKNKGNTIAYMIGLRIAGENSHQEILPSYWSDNYFSLLPGEEKIVTVETTFSGQFEQAVLEFKAFNMPEYQLIDLPK